MTPKWLDSVCLWIAFRLPRRIVFYAHYRLETEKMFKKVKAEEEQKA